MTARTAAAVAAAYLAEVQQRTRRLLLYTGWMGSTGMGEAVSASVGHPRSTCYVGPAGNSAGRHAWNTG